MRRDPARVRKFLARWYAWAEAHGMTVRRFSPQEFWQADSMLRRLDALVFAHFKASGSRAVAAEDFIFQAMDDSDKRCIRLDWPAFLKSWKGLFVRLGFKIETIEATNARRPKPKAKEAK